MSAERTLVVLKPDALQRGIAFEILSRFEKRGLRFAALRLLKVDRAMAERHYAVHKGKFFYDDLVGVITASPVVAAVLEGPNAIAVVRAMVGSTRPHEATEGSIRGVSIVKICVPSSNTSSIAGGKSCAPPWATERPNRVASPTQ